MDHCREGHYRKSHIWQIIEKISDESVGDLFSYQCKRKYSDDEDSDGHNEYVDVDIINPDPLF